MGWMFCIFLAILKETFSPILQQTNSKNTAYPQHTFCLKKASEPQGSL